MDQLFGTERLYIDDFSGQFLTGLTAEGFFAAVEILGADTGDHRLADKVGKGIGP